MAAIARNPLRCGDIARVHGAVPAADSTIDAWSALALTLVLTGGAIDNRIPSHPEIPVPSWLDRAVRRLPGQRVSSSASFAA
jgi:hypothetical protein